jgi:diguanylate cyclase (GGDEF)-like protein
VLDDVKAWAPTVRGHRITAAVGTLAAFYGLGGLMLLVAAAFPFSPAAPASWDVGLGLLGLAMCAVLLLAADRITTPMRHVLVAVITILICWLVSQSATAEGGAITLMPLTTVAVYAAMFFPRSQARVHFVLIAVCTALALWGADGPRPIYTWCIAVLTATVVGEVLSHTVARMQRQATTDPLTGALTRQGFTAAATRCLSQCLRGGSPVSLAVLDLDGFKAVNDRYGHPTGDLLLQELTAAWATQLREGDLLGRHGGDEFVLLLPHTTAATADRALWRLRQAHPALWTAGVSTRDPHGTGTDPAEVLESMIEQADQELIAAKAGRTVSRQPSVSQDHG